MISLHSSIMSTHLTSGIILMVALGTAVVTVSITQLSPQFSYGTIALQGPERRVAVALSGDIAWLTNKTGNNEVVFRSSNDAGVTFSDLIILSNATDEQMQDVQIAAESNNVIVTWWQTNATSNDPVARVSTNNGQTFTSVFNLASNGTISVIA
jgi:hypothetical protein